MSERLSAEAIQQIATIREDLPPDVCDEFQGSERHALARHDLCRRCRHTLAMHDVKFLLGVIAALQRDHDSGWEAYRITSEALAKIEDLHKRQG